MKQTIRLAVVSLAACTSILAASLPSQANTAETVPTSLAAHPNQRFLVHRGSGEPFLFFSDTAWEILRHLDREQIIEYLDIRKRQGFTAIQLLAHGHYYGPNRYGDTPFLGDIDFTDPAVTPGSDPGQDDAYDWWDHLEFLIREAIERDMYVALLPTWRQQWAEQTNLTKDNAETYGRFIGRRYRQYNDRIIWIMGGDMPVRTEDDRLLHQRLARGVAIGVGGSENYSAVMMSYHTSGPGSTVDLFPEHEPFMDFNTLQSGQKGGLGDLMTAGYYAHNKPIMDLEPKYHKNGEWVDQERHLVYWGMFEGGFGASMGSWNVWHFGALEVEFDHPDSYTGTIGGFAEQIVHLKNLFASRPFLTRIPDNTVLASGTGSGDGRLRATRSSDGSYAMVYSPSGSSFTVDMAKLSGSSVTGWWYNPRTGAAAHLDRKYPSAGTQEFHPPTSGEAFSEHDWVLVLDDASREFPVPGDALPGR